MGTIFNRSNESAVKAFLDHQIKFLDIERIIALSLDNMKYIKNPTLEDIIKIDNDTRIYADKLIDKIKKGEKI